MSSLKARVRFRGGWTCQCLATILPIIERDMIAAGIIKHSIDITQLGYSVAVADSAGTHAAGGVIDTAQYSPAALKIWRTNGVEVQHRTRGQGFSSEHGHGVVKGCPHLSAAARRQAADWERGINGLRGRGPVTGPGPTGKITPTWQQAYNRRQTANQTVPEPTNPHQVKVGDTVQVTAGQLHARTSPAGPVTGLLRPKGFTFLVKDVHDGWATGGKNWYSTDWLTPLPALPQPTNPRQVKIGDRVKVIAAGGLRARTRPGGPPTIADGTDLIRPKGYELTIKALQDGWASGGKNWYSTDWLTPATAGKISWTPAPAKILVTSKMAGPVTYLQALVRVAPLRTTTGSWPACYLLAQDRDGDTCFTQFDAHGEPVDQMTVRKGGHGSSFHAYRSAAGTLYIWTWCRNSASGMEAHRIAWQPGRTVTAGHKMDYRGRRPVGSHEPYVGMRAGHKTYELLSIHDRRGFTAGDRSTKPIHEVRLPKRPGAVQQTWLVDINRIYRLSGATAKPPGSRPHLLEIFDWTGRPIATRNLASMSIPTTSDEPEGLTFTGTPGQLLAGKREGGSKPNRSYPIWTLNGATQ